MKQIVNVKRGLFAAALLLTMVNIGCTKKEISAVGADGRYKLTVGRLGASSLISPMVLIATEKQYFDKYNVDIDLKLMDSATSSEALSMGKMDCIYQEFNQQMASADQGAKITIFAGNRSGGVYVIARKEDAEELYDIANWKGKTIGLIGPTTNIDYITDYVLRNDYGIDTDKDVKYFKLNDMVSLQQALKRGQVDITFADPLYTETLDEQGLTILYPLSHVQKDYVCCRQMAWTTAFEAKPDAYKNYLKAQILAYRDYYTDRDAAIKLLLAASGQDEDYVVNYIYDRSKNADKYFNPDPNYNGVLAQFKSMIRLGYTPGARELYEFFNISVYASALKEILQEYPGDPYFTDLKELFLKNNNQYPDFEKTYKTYF
ncbi:MAG: ABC transporter substrate-binding protein [Treponema sp.]|nr:ABC transporter substrate-binding protein [Treponema sp.]